MNTADSKKSLEDMTDDELRSLISGVRDSRKKPRKAAAKPKKVASPKKAKSIESQLDSLSAEQREALLAMLQKKG